MSGLPVACPARIFVSIASYRDPETPPTLEDMYAKARHPERVFAGVLWQVAPEIDDECRLLPPGVPATQVRGATCHPGDSLGACWARHRILTELRQDEDFVLQIDSHMRFVDGWDEKLLAMWARCESPRAMLSTYPVAYTPPDVLDDMKIPVLCASKFNHRGVLTFLARSQHYACRPSRPQPNAFVSAGFLFATAQAFDAVPYDPHLYFHGEEISLSARLWTHGWDAYTPDDVLIYHFYGQSRERPRHWTDNPDWGPRNERALSRIRHVLGIEPSSDPLVVAEIERYGLGQVRTLDEYQRYADVDFRQQKTGPAGWGGRFPPHPDPERLPLRRMFEHIHQANVWGVWETRSGSGSTEPATAALKPAFSRLLADLEIRSLLDAGCGDMNWITAATGMLDSYSGVDIVEALVTQNMRLFGQRRGHFFTTADITRDPLPRVDAVLCRHVLTHLPTAEIQRALKNFAACGARWLIATTYESADNTETKPGHWRRLDLERAPFCLPAPVQYLADGNGCRLGVWRIGEES